MTMKILEKYNNFINNDLRKIYIFFHSDRVSFSHIDGLIRSVSAELFMLLMPPGIFPNSIDVNLPVFNYGNNNELQKLLDDGIVNPENVYNLPENLIYANSKVDFHKITKDLPFVPKTVFNIEEIDKLKFPIIAKPSKGSKGEGIKVFKTKESLNKSKEKFDIFSEKFDLKREFRIISIKGKIIFVAERIPQNDKAKSLRENQLQNKDIFDREGTLVNRSSYKWTKVEFGKEIPDEREFSKICSSINTMTKLEFLGIDIGLDSSGKLWAIECNSCPGLNKDQIVLIYIALFEDFYGKKPDEKTMKLIKQYQNILLLANDDPAKFSFSAHQGNKFYSYSDKVDDKTGDILTSKFNIEKSFSDSLLNIKKIYMKTNKNESMIQSFENFFLNEKQETKTGEQIIKDIVSGKLKPLEVIPHSYKDKTKFSFQDPDEDEDGEFHEEAEFFLPNDELLVVKFSWAYIFTAGIKGGYDMPDDPNEYTLDSINIEEATYNYNEGETEEQITLTPEISSLLRTYLEKFILT